jgi:hypothetical protein
VQFTSRSLDACGCRLTYSSPHDKVPGKVLPVLLRSRRVEGLRVVLSHCGVFAQGLEEGDGGVEETFVLRVSIARDHDGQLIDVLVVELGAGCRGGVERRHFLSLLERLV